ncbi:hypothetical protein BDV97DRAFT_359473 [Delphinella strobiligena]|nr:hypothetical protein BDV97DRAFT_359473 [Delphinella strobiligena]
MISHAFHIDSQIWMRPKTIEQNLNYWRRYVSYNFRNQKLRYAKHVIVKHYYEHLDTKLASKLT